MSINASTGIISWTPGLAGTYPVVVKASNPVGSVTQSYALVVAETQFQFYLPQIIK
jgi:hypothetical protein